MSLQKESSENHRNIYIRFPQFHSIVLDRIKMYLFPQNNLPNSLKKKTSNLKYKPNML